MTREQQAIVHEPRPFSELRDAGLLWLINRQVFHPRGWALALHTDDEGNTVGWSLMGDGVEPWNFKDGEENDLLAAATRTMQPLPQPADDEALS